MKYGINVYLKNGNISFVKLDEFNDMELIDIDKYIEKMGGYSSFKTFIANKSSINIDMIDKIKILYLRKDIEFSIVSNNPYLSKTLASFKEKQVKGNNGNYFYSTYALSFDNKNYQEMKQYLFNMLRTNPNFVDGIYKYRNSFSDNLRKYATSYHECNDSEEENRNLIELEDSIENSLIKYKNYRSICIARYMSENQFLKKHTNAETKKEEPLQYKTKEPTFHEFNQDDINQLNNFINDDQEEKEEFIELEEYTKYYR